MIFAKTRHEYGSYQDFWKLVELSGFTTCYVDEIDGDSDHCYIFTPANGETAGGWTNHSARIIHWQMEWQTEAHLSPPGVTELWAMDAVQADRLRAHYVPIGSHPALNLFAGYESRFEKAFDVVHLAYQNSRRGLVTEVLAAEGLNLAPTHNLWGSQRSTALLASRLMLHSHQWDDQRGVTGLRWALAAAHRLPLLSETVDDRGFFQPRHFTQADYHFLATAAAFLLKDDRLLKEYANALYEWLCVEWTFRKVVEAAL